MTSLVVTIDEQDYEIELNLAPQAGDAYVALVNGEPATLILPDKDVGLPAMQWIIVDQRPYEVTFDVDLQWIRSFDGIHRLSIQDRSERVARPRSGDGRIKAPIPGLITRLLAAPGDEVKAGQPLLVLEAMKMENEIRAPFDGVLNSVGVTVGQSVIRNEVLAEVV